ncbi:MAG: hypothetical protein [Podoviridae sp. ctLUJ1]|nr:MAG: hypothetical protein [Podoviridae sp. ctLUJ1]
MELLINLLEWINQGVNSLLILAALLVSIGVTILIYCK